LIVEVSHPSIILKYGVAFLQRADLFVGSPTAFADQSFETELRKVAAQVPTIQLNFVNEMTHIIGKRTWIVYPFWRALGSAGYSKDGQPRISSRINRQHGKASSEPQIAGSVGREAKGDPCR